MKILVLGSGGREHALAWKLAQSPRGSGFAAPGDLEIAEAIGADLTVVGPEAPLVAGVVDAFRARRRKIVGPDRTAAQLEGSKVFAKNFLTQSKIPTAEYVVVDTEADARFVPDRFGFPVV